MLFRARGVRGKSAHLPPTCMDIERVATPTMLGVVVNDRLMATDHVNHLLSSAARLLYALRILRSHGTPTQSLYDIFCATVIAKLTYCSPAWAGSCSAAERSRLNSFLTRCKRFGFCDNNLEAIEVLFSEADDTFFSVSSITIYMIYRLFTRIT